MQPFPQTFATFPANVCNRPCKRLHPGSQPFIWPGKWPFPSPADGSYEHTDHPMRHCCMGSEWVRNAHLGESEVRKSAHSSWISCTKEAVCATFFPILREEAARMKVSKWHDFGGYWSILFTITLYDFTSVIRFFRLSVCWIAIATLKSRPAIRRWRG